MDLGERKIRVKKASIGATQVAGVEMGVAAMSMLAGTTATDSDESRVLQLETLAAGIYTKRHLWQALAAVSDQVATLDRSELEHLVRRADAQLARLDAHHAPAARVAFGGADEQL